MNKDEDGKKVMGLECRFAIHMPTRSSDVPDFHLVKEVLHFDDGTIKPNVTFIRDYKRSFGVTKPSYRNHQQKKEYEVAEKLNIYHCTQSDLRVQVAKALGKAWSNANLRQLAESPYLYGSDISSTALIKHDYAVKYPDAVSPYTVAYFDIETDVLHGSNDPVMATLVFGKKIITAVTKAFLQGYSSPEDRLQRLVTKHLQTYVDKYQFEIDFRIVDTTVDVIKECLKSAHELSPDFLAIWNMDFDIPRILETLEKYGVNPKDVFCDPKVPKELRFCKYKKGSTKKVTASGAVKPKNPSEQWHSLLVPAGFYVIDAMCSYRFIRQGAQELPYYSLDYVLNKELGLRKLNFEEAKGEVEEGTLDWHVFMQDRYPFEYIVYNIFDCVGMLELETKTNDLQQALPIQSAFTDFARYSSQTKKFADKYHFFLLEQGKMIGTIAPIEAKSEEVEIDEPPAEDDEEAEDPEAEEKDSVLSLKQWIVTLPAHMSSLGKPLLKGMPTVLTMIRAFVYDSDAVSAYPSCTAVANVSRETTVREIIDIVGIDETTFRRQNINLLQGHVNALEYACVMHGLPKPQEALVLFDDL